MPTMTKPTPAMIKVLREAKYWGDLVEHGGKIFSCGEDAPVSFYSKATVRALIQRGWLKPWRSRFEITNAGKLAEREF